MSQSNSPVPECDGRRWDFRTAHLHHNVVRQAFKRATTRLGLPVIRFHDLRHTAATIALADGENPKVIQQRLGHADISMTLNRYSHVTTAMQHAATERLEKLLGG